MEGRQLLEMLMVYPCQLRESMVVLDPIAPLEAGLVHYRFPAMLVAMEPG